MTDPTPADLARLRALERSATPGPWTADDEDFVIGPPDDEHGCMVCRMDAESQDADAALIAAARNALPGLLAAAEERDALKLRVAEQASIIGALDRTLGVTQRERDNAAEERARLRAERDDARTRVLALAHWFDELAAVLLGEPTDPHHDLDRLMPAVQHMAAARAAAEQQRDRALAALRGCVDALRAGTVAPSRIAICACSTQQRARMPGARPCWYCEARTALATAEAALADMTKGGDHDRR